MNCNMQVTYATFRRIGSRGLVIFERDGTLLRRNSRSKDIMLGDISDDFVEMLKELRGLGICFGFISDDRGMDACSHGPKESAALTRLFYDLLEIRDAMPDFWLASSDFTHGSEGEFQDRDNLRQHSAAVCMILQAIEWYGVDKQNAVFVGATTLGLLAASDAGVAGVQYFGLRSDRTTPLRTDIELQSPSPSETMEIERLRGQIERILGQGHRGSAYRIRQK